MEVGKVDMDRLDERDALDLLAVMAEHADVETDPGLEGVLLELHALELLGWVRSVLRDPGAHDELQVQTAEVAAAWAQRRGLLTASRAPGIVGFRRGRDAHEEAIV